MFPTRHREHRFVLSVVFYVVSGNPQNRIPPKSCKKQKKTPEIRGFQVFLWSCWADLNRRPHPYQLLFVHFPLYRSFVRYRLFPLWCNTSPAVLFFCLLSLAFLNLFGVLVWFLSGFLSATLTADLIPIGQKTRHNAPPLAFDTILCYPDLGAAGQQRSALLTEGSFFALRSSERRAAHEYIRSSSALFGHHWYLQPVYSGKKEVTAGTLTSTAITSSSL